MTGAARARIPDYVDALVQICTSRSAERRPPTGRDLEEMIARARRKLAAGVLADPQLAQDFADGAFGELTPIAPTDPLEIGQSTLVLPDLTAHRGPNQAAKGPRPPTVKLAPAPPDHRQALPRPNPHPTPNLNPPSARRWPVIVIPVAIALVISLIMVWALVWRYTTVPSVAGLTADDAQTILASFKVSVEEEYSETVLPGTVIGTRPAEEARIAKGGALTLLVSKGPERYPMPTVIGLAEAQARELILSGHFAVGDVTQGYSDSAPIGQVIDASQDPDTPLPPGTKIDLVISKGPEPIEIASYVDQPVDDAVAALEALGFKVDTNTHEFSTTVDKDHVIRQDPNQGTGKRGDTITLVISDGPKMIKIPSVMGLSRADATQKLRSVGFQVEEQNQNPSGTTWGVVMGTDPGAGKLAPEGSTVILKLL